MSTARLRFARRSKRLFPSIAQRMRCPARARFLKTKAYERLPATTEARPFSSALPSAENRVSAGCRFFFCVLLPFFRSSVLPSSLRPASSASHVSRPTYSSGSKPHRKKSRRSHTVGIPVCGAAPIPRSGSNSGSTFCSQFSRKNCFSWSRSGPETSDTAQKLKPSFSHAVQ